MTDVITSNNALHKDDDIEFNIQFPCFCPHCSQNIFVKHLKSFHIRPTYGGSITIYANFLCPSCEEIFMAIYKGYPAETLIPFKIIPETSERIDFDTDISKISPGFIKIYNESFQAEQNGLTEICGMGYRKALEFLVKDFAINLHPEEIEKIKKQPLAQCIENFIDSPKIKTLSKASAWIGNDETHYCRQHEDYNIDHLKAFINASVSYINSELELKKAEQLVGKSD